MALNQKAQEALDAVVEKFRDGDLGPLVEVSRIQLPDDAPALAWSFGNRVLAFAQTGSIDCRGYRQWQAVGRQVRKGERSAYILAPRVVRSKDDDGEVTERLIGWLGVPVFGYDQTDGEEGTALDYAPAELPPLHDVAVALGIEVDWQPTPGPVLGHCDTGGTRIGVGTHDVTVWFHELAHALHARLNGKLAGGQDAHQETVAEFTATVLMWLYGFGDRTANCWRYVSMYSDDPLRAVVKALGDVGQIVEFITEQVEG